MIPMSPRTIGTPDYRIDEPQSVVYPSTPSGLCHRCMMPSHTSPCATCRAKENGGVTPPASLHDVACRALTEPLMSVTPIREASGIKLRWTGSLASCQREKILTYMEGLGAWITPYPGITGAIYHSDSLDISATLLEGGRDCSIAAWDRSEPVRRAPSALLVIQGGAA